MEICGFSSEKVLTKRQVAYSLNQFKKTARVGFEIEGNIPAESCCYGCEHFVEPRYCCSRYCSRYGEEDDEYRLARDVDCLEQRRRVHKIYEELAEELGCDVGHNRHYIEGRDFQCIYYDGSVNVELVTGAVALSRVRDVLLRGYKALEVYDVKLSPAERAGEHQTISYRGTYHKPVARNVLQLVRYYLPALIGISCVRGTGKRDIEFRSIPECGYRQHKRIVNPKYTALHIKGEYAVRSKPKLLEFRYPDSHVNINQTLLTAVLNMAIIAKAMKLSMEGIAHFSQKHFDQVKKNTLEVYWTGAFVDLHFVEGLVIEMLEYLSEEISLFTDMKRIKAGIGEITTRGFLIENGYDICTSPIN